MSNNIKSCFLIDNERITCRRIIANKFNNSFVSLASNLNMSVLSEIPVNQLPPFQSYLEKPCESSIFLEDCDSDEINDIIKDLQSGKSSDIPISIVKKSGAIISPILAKIYNSCMMTGEFPKILKVGKITPVFKKGNKDLIENYRPVSTLPIFGKFFEKIIFSRLYSFLTAKSILHDKQFGFRKSHSTSHALHSIYYRYN